MRTLVKLLLFGMLVSIRAASQHETWTTDAKEQSAFEESKNEHPLKGLFDAFSGLGKSIHKAKRTIELLGLTAMRNLVKLPSMQHHGPSNLETDDDELDDVYYSFNSKEQKVYDEVIRGKKRQPNHDRVIKRSLQNSGAGSETDPEGVGLVGTGQTEQAQILKNILNQKNSTVVREVFDFQYNPCMNGGVESNVTVKAAVCNQTALRPEEYNRYPNKAECVNVTALIDGCYCPFDYFGRQCQKFMGFTCRHINFTGYDQACLSEYQRYGKNRIGYPPCRPFNSNGTYDFEIYLKCGALNLTKVYSNSHLLQEGVKLEYLFADSNNLEVIQNSTGVPPFDYVLKKPGEYNISTDMELNMGLSYLNWGDLFEEYATPNKTKVSDFVTNPVTKEGGLDNLRLFKTFNLAEIKAGADTAKFYQYGRVPFKLMVNYNTSAVQMATVGFPKLFIIDDMTYTLPPAVKKVSYMYILYIVIAVVVVLLLAFIVIRFYLKSKGATTLA